MKGLCIFLLFMWMAPLFSQSTITSEQPIETLYILGDAGYSTGENPLLEKLKTEWSTVNEDASVVFLGDNLVTPTLSVRDSFDVNLYKEKNVLIEQLESLQPFQGKSYFLSGEKDWNNGHAGGTKAVKAQEEFIEKFYEDKKVRMVPSNACGDPKVVKINKDLIYVFLNSQWWLQNWEKEELMNKGCDLKTRRQLLVVLEQIIGEHKNDQIILFMHHPLKSNGHHGGRFSFIEHVFPLTMVNKNLFVPLPFIGSSYPIYKNVSGSHQDLAHELYRELINGIEGIIFKYKPNIVLAGAHDHNLQYFGSEKKHYLVSGSASNSTFVARSKSADYVNNDTGFSKLKFYEDGSSFIEFYILEDDQLKLDYQHQLTEKKDNTKIASKEYPSVDIDSFTMAPNENFQAGPLHEKILGKNYRDLWATSVTYPAIDLEKQNGGLEIIKKGGGMSSNSLRVQANDGKQYILRSVNKVYTRNIPIQFRKLKAINLLRDQNSSNNLYAPMVLDNLSEAVGIYFNRPMPYFLKHQKALGPFNDLLDEGVYLFEERPAGDWSDSDLFGGSEEIIGYVDMLDKLYNKKSHKIDQEWTFKTRLFDILIHDRDRHDDQFRYGAFKDENGTTYRPIPRDRDFAFFQADGFIPWLNGHLLTLRAKPYGEEIQDIVNFCFQSKDFDRSFLNELDRADWKRLTNEFINDLSDDLITDAMKDFPKEMDRNLVNDIGKKLISRRATLLEQMMIYYDFISKEVEVVGTNENDKFIISNNTNGDLTVRVYTKRKNKDDFKRYERSFNPDETKEVRLYGLDGKDEFKLEGPPLNDIKLRIIGGEDKDKIKDEGTSSKKLLIYDFEDGIDIPKSVTFKDKRSDDIEVNAYDRSGFLYNGALPAINLGFDNDLGFFFGGGYNMVINGWRYKPFKSKHSFNFLYAPSYENAFKVSYDGTYTDALFSKVDLLVELELQNPEFQNYYGIGNEAIAKRGDRQFHRIKMSDYHATFQGRKHLTEALEIAIGPSIQFRNLQRIEGRVLTDDFYKVDDKDIGDKTLVGLNNHLVIDYLDNPVFTRNGVKIGIDHHLIRNIQNEVWTNDVHLYAKFFVQAIRKPALVIGQQYGYSAIWGDAMIYQYPSLGNKQHLRGYNNERFRARELAYWNTDIRLQLFDWKNAYLPVKIGLLGGYDIGWILDDKADALDNYYASYTAGIWLNFFDFFVVNIAQQFTKEQNPFQLKFEFDF